MLRATGSVRECRKKVRRWNLRRWRRASLAARLGSSGGSASGRGFRTLGRDVGFVGGRVNLADGLHRLHSAKGLSNFDFCSRLGQLDENHVAQFMLCVVGNPDRCESAFHADPFVFFGVAVILRVGHQVTPWIRLRPIRIRAAPLLSSDACKTASGPPAPYTSAREFPRTASFPRQNTLAARTPAQYFFPASARASRSSPPRWLHLLHCSSNIRRAQFRGRSSPDQPGCAAIPPLSLVPAPRVPRNRPFPPCSSGPARLPTR